MPLIEQDVPLTPYNTFGIAARARRMARCATPADVEEACGLARRHGWPVFVLGGGSNIVLTGDFDGLVLKVETRGIELLAEDAEHRLVRARAGENWHGFVVESLVRGWQGLENLSLIPGTVGAAPVQNIGAYGVELEQVFHQLTALELATGMIRVFDRAACAFGYRDSRFKRADHGRFVIMDVTFHLPCGATPVADYAELRAALDARGIARPSAREVSEAVIAIRRAKLPDPAGIGNAGSFFKNPLVSGARVDALRAQWPDLVAYPQADGRFKLAAGWLIDHAGWKGRSLGGAAVYERQALVLVNRGGATGAEVIALARAIQADILERYGVELDPEPEWV